MNRLLSAACAASLLAACGGGDLCTPSTCAGCCDSNGVCEGGSSTQACGSMGNSCLSCAFGQNCQAGSCLAPSSNIGPALGGDSGTPDSGAPFDAGKPADAGVDAGVLNCRVYSAYPGGYPVSGYFGTGSDAPPNDYTVGALLSDSLSPRNQLRLEIWHGFGPGGVVTLPAQRTFSASTKAANCDVCATIGESCTSSGCKTTFFAQGGTLTVTRADRTTSAGRVTASGSNLRFREWDNANDRPLSGGKCIDVVGLNLDNHWGSVGGCATSSCSAGFSSGQCCAAAPYCTSTGTTLTFCSDMCGTTGDTCKGTADSCCPGFKCFLGSCVGNTCMGNGCTKGYQAGGCCSDAPYCTGSSSLGCRPQCGNSGDHCTASADCCTGMQCNAGTCQ